MDSPAVNCVLVGDGATGKTSLIVSYTCNGYPNEYTPTAFDNYSVVVNVNEVPVQLQLCDTAGQHDFDSIRPLCYENADVFLVCFSVVLPSSFYNTTEKWLPEIRQRCPNSPVILIGTQCDLRSDVKVLIELSTYGDRPVTEEQARAKASAMDALTYIECSALTQHNLKEVFDAAISAGLGHLAGVHPKTRSSAKSITSAHRSRAMAISSPKNRRYSKQKAWWKALCCSAS